MINLRASFVSIELQPKGDFSKPLKTTVLDSGTF